MDMDILKDTVKLMQTPPGPTPDMDTVKLMQNSLMPNSVVLLKKLVTTTAGRRQGGVDGCGAEEDAEGEAELVDLVEEEDGRDVDEHPLHVVVDCDEDLEGERGYRGRISDYLAVLDALYICLLGATRPHYRLRHIFYY